MVKIEDVSNTAEFVIDELKKWTEYRVWMLAGTIVGDGPSSYPVLVRTGEDGMPLIFNTKNFDHTIKRFLFFFTLNKIHGTVFQGEVLCNYVSNKENKDIFLNTVYSISNIIKWQDVDARNSVFGLKTLPGVV